MLSKNASYNRNVWLKSAASATLILSLAGCATNSSVSPTPPPPPPAELMKSETASSADFSQRVLDWQAKWTLWLQKAERELAALTQR
jgi:hypothetical protein